MKKYFKRGSIFYAVIFVILAIMPILTENPLVLRILIISGIFIILSMSLNLILGYTGLLSLAQAGFFGIGAYSYALLVLDFHFTFLLALLFSGLITSAISFVVGIPALRLSKHSFVIATLALVIILPIIISNTSFAGGALGLPGIPIASIRLLGISIYFHPLFYQYYLVFFFLGLVLILLYGIANSRIGRVFIAIREDEALAKSAGIDIQRYKLIAFVVAAFVAAIGGALYAQYVTFIDTTIFDLYFTEVPLIVVIVGGAGSLLGVLLSGFVFTIAPELLRITQVYRLIIYGIILLVAVILMPEGIAGVVSKLKKRS